MKNIQDIIFVSVLVIIMVFALMAMNQIASADYNQVANDLLCIGKHITCK